MTEENFEITGGDMENVENMNPHILGTNQSEGVSEYAGEIEALEDQIKNLLDNGANEEDENVKKFRAEIERLKALTQ